MWKGNGTCWEHATRLMGPNPDGEGACKTYRRTGECKWGAKCTWRHTREDYSDAEDDRGI